MTFCGEIHHIVNIVVCENRFEALEDARAVNRLHNSFFGNKCINKSERACRNGGYKTCGNIERAHLDFECASADKVDKQTHEDFGSLLNEARKQVCLSDKAGTVDNVRSNRCRHTRSCNSNQRACKVREHLQYQIKRQLRHIIQRSVAEYERHHIEHDGNDNARDGVNNQPGLELAPTGTGSVNDCGKENIVYDIPDADNEGDDLLKSEADTDNIRNENVVILVYVKALGNIVKYVSDSFL